MIDFKDLKDSDRNQENVGEKETIQFQIKYK